MLAVPLSYIASHLEAGKAWLYVVSVVTLLLLTQFVLYLSLAQAPKLSRVCEDVFIFIIAVVC